MKSQGLQNTRILERPQSGGPLRPLQNSDFRGGPLMKAASPKLMPLNAPEMQSGGRFHQMMESAALKPLADTDRIPGVKLKPTDKHAALTEQAQKWVAQTFFGTLMKQMHDSPFKSELFSGGRGGEAFQTMMDQHLVERMSRASGQKLVRGLVRQMEGREAYRKQAARGKAANTNSAEQFDALNAEKDPEPPKSNPTPRSHVAPRPRA